MGGGELDVFVHVEGYDVFEALRGCGVWRRGVEESRGGGGSGRKGEGSVGGYGWLME